MRIVIVEDEAVIREGLANMINQNTSHAVIGKCKSGEEGVELISRMKPDCVITDIRMGEMTGLEMLDTLHKQDVMPESIIISGYSEFEYAREGIRLGVEDYLLKPVFINDLKAALAKIEKKILDNRNIYGSQWGNCVRAYLFGTEMEWESAKEKLQKQFPKDNDIYAIFVGYYGTIEKETKAIEQALRHLKQKYSQYTYMDTAEGRLGLRIFIVKAPQEEMADFNREFEQMVVCNPIQEKYEIPWAVDTCESIEEWKNTFEEVQKMMSCCLSEGCEKLLYAEESGKIQRKELNYPFHLEKKLLSSLGEGNKADADKWIDEFLVYSINSEYDAEDIRQGILKLMTRMIDTAKEVNQKAYETLRSKNYMQNVLMTYTRTEIGEILHEMGEVICEKEVRDGISNYTINRTVEYIRIHYMEGISLEETAEALNITPEYLSMLFKREMGMNFSVFLKKFRISHAKRLLKGTDMKIYEVAEACGYNNSNYFTKVFKEETGISPADYR
ncbi:MAG: response regulator [Lachnospiraceae bacterium]|nr:response regulator [Lachnospiraceae bacterium]